MPQDTRPRRILHADLDAFYAAVEQRDHPELRGKPVIVGGRPEDRGVVATASYEARRFGVHSAMPTRTALRLCPEGVLVRPNFAAYHDVSRQVLAIYADWTPLLEPIALDEAYLDLTPLVGRFDEAIAAARAIRDRVRQEAGLTVSVGAGSSKLVAKIASDLAKPDGLKVVWPGEEQEFLRPLPVGRIWGIGPKTAETLQGLGVHTIADLGQRTPEELEGRFGRAGRHWHELALGRDDRAVETDRPLQQISRETTFAQDLSDPALALETLERLAAAVVRHIAELDAHGRTVTLKLRFEDFRTVTRQVTLAQSVDDLERLVQHGKRLLETAWEPGRKLRLMGIGVSHFQTEVARQLSFFEDGEFAGTSAVWTDGT